MYLSMTYICVHLRSNSVFTDSSDFSLGATSVTIPAGVIPSSGNDCVSLSAIDDTILEGNEGLVVIITGADQGVVTVGPSATTTVTITDNDGRSKEIF